jgi:hypothetical protein
VATQTGTYQWSATYNGDANNNPVSSDAGSEPVGVTPDTPGITTTASAGGIVGQVTLNDTAHLTGGDNPTGSITFTLTAPDNTVAYTQTVTVNGDGDYSTSPGVVATQTGTYQWSATYNGDANNNPVSSDAGSEPVVVVSPPSIGINTTPGGTILLGSGAKLTDTAVLSGGINPTGKITFRLYKPGTTTNPVDTEVVTVTGNGPYTTPKGYVPTLTGTYQWVATYSGDAHNASVASGFGDEPEAVIAPHVTVVKTAVESPIPGGNVPLGIAAFLITIKNVGVGTATGVTLFDMLPFGPGHDLVWSINLKVGTPLAFTISGPPGGQVLTLVGQPISLAQGQTLSVQVLAQTTAADAPGQVVNTVTVTAANELPNYQHATSTATITVKAPPPVLKATVSSTPQVNLTWTEASNMNVAGAGFTVQEFIGGSWVTITTPPLSGNTFTFTDTNVSHGVTYKYRIDAFDSFGDNSYSNIITIKVP